MTLLKEKYSLCNFGCKGHLRDDLHNLSIFNEKIWNNLFLSIVFEAYNIV